MGKGGKKRKVGSVRLPEASTSKNPKRAARKLDDSYFDTTAVKCTLNPIVEFAVVANEIRKCVETMAVVFYHTHLAMILFLACNKGSLILRGEEVDKNMQSLWDAMARAMYRCLHGQAQHVTGSADMYNHCRGYCEKFKLWESLPDRKLGWYGHVLEELAARSATNHKTHLDTNLHIYAQRYIHVLIDTDNRFATIRGLKTADFNKVISAVTYGDTEETQEETIETIIARRPSTHAEYDAACEAIANAKNQAARERAEDKKAHALHTGHAAWAEAEVLRAEWRGLVGGLVVNGMYSEKSKRVYSILARCREHGETLQQLVRQAAMDKKNKKPQGPKRKKRKWAFALCPVLEYAPLHVPINSTALRKMFAQLAKDYPFIGGLLQKAKSKEEALGEDATDHERNFLYWKALFNVHKPLKKKFFEDSGRVRFGNHIQTDGVGVSLTINKRKSDVAIEKMELAREIKEVEKTFAEDDERLAKLKARKEELDKKTRKPTNHQYMVSPELEAKVKSKFEIVDNKICVKPGDGGDNDLTACALDPGKSSLATVVEMPADPNEKHRHDDVKAGEWIFMSGQKQYTKKMTKRTKEGCPKWFECPSLKTEVVEDLIEAIRHRVSLLPDMHALRFKDLWAQKQRMRKFVKRQRALETVVARFCGTKNKVKQKENVVVALGDADLRGNMRGKPPVMSTTWVKHLARCTNVVLVNEFRSSMLCSACHQKMHQQRNCFRVKRCLNSDCSRSFWNRDVNAAINILNLFLWAVLLGDGCCSASSKSRPEAFRRKKGCDE